ncbi:hypothetical protein [Sphingorhabdus sp.]|uniref:hypothetical protein n=1 Tax=Sphingorhabdus sp. TaxID=1902408 RepID=UPI0039832479
MTASQRLTKQANLEQNPFQYPDGFGKIVITGVSKQLTLQVPFNDYDTFLFLPTPVAVLQHVRSDKNLLSNMSNDSTYTDLESLPLPRFARSHPYQPLVETGLRLRCPAPTNLGRPSRFMKSKQSK